MGNLPCCTTKDYQHVQMQETDKTKQFSRQNSKPYSEMNTQAQTIALDKEQSYSSAKEQIAVKDNLSKYEFQGHQSLMISELDDNQNEFETSLEFSKQGIKNHIERMLELEESGVELPKWQAKINRPELKIYIKKGGKNFKQNMSYIKTQATFEGNLKLEVFIDMLINVKQRLKWDNNVDCIEKQSMQKKCCCVNYQQNHTRQIIGAIDFIDKMIQFADEGNFYSYSSFIPNSEYIKPVPEGTRRAKHAFNILKISRNTEDKSIVLTSLVQIDLSSQISIDNIDRALAIQIDDQTKKLSKFVSDYIESNHNGDKSI